MTAPIAYVAKDPTIVYAMLFDGTTASYEAIMDWVVPTLAEGQTTNLGPYGTSMSISGGDLPAVIVYKNWYIYLDDDGYHTVEKGAFELFMKPDDGV